MGGAVCACGYPSHLIVSCKQVCLLRMSMCALVSVCLSVCVRVPQCHGFDGQVSLPSKREGGRLRVLTSHSIT